MCEDPAIPLTIGTCGKTLFAVASPDCPARNPTTSSLVYFELLQVFSGLIVQRYCQEILCTAVEPIEKQIETNQALTKKRSQRSVAA